MVYASTPKDGRIAALASYIISKSGAKTPDQAVQAVNTWVINNLPPDISNMSIPAVSFGTSTETFGYGKTHNHRTSIAMLGSTGVCIDYTNLASDLLNSIGIPSRTLIVSSHGIVPDDIETSTSLSQLIKSISHSLLEVHLPSGSRFFNITPMSDSHSPKVSTDVTPIAVPWDYMQVRLENRYPGIKTIRVICFRSIPESELAGFPKMKAALDKDKNGALEASDLLFGDKLDKKLSKLLYTIGSDYNYHSWDYFYDMMGSHPERFAPRQKK